MRGTEVVWELDRRLSATARRWGTAIVVVGVVVPMVLGAAYAAQGVGVVGNPWWHPFMAALTVGGFSAGLSAAVLHQRNVRWVITGDGVLHRHAGRRHTTVDLRRFDRVTVKRVADRTSVPSGPVSRGSTVHVTVVNGWERGNRAPTATRIGVLSREQEQQLRAALRTAR